MELKDLVGLHELSGVDTTIEKLKPTEYYPGDCNVVRFVLDGITYKVIEDPDDGLRSFCEELQICDEVVSNNFSPQKVFGKMKENYEYTKNDVIQFSDAVTGKIVLEIGTDYYDDIYPTCIIKWTPENLSCNIGK